MVKLNNDLGILNLNKNVKGKICYVKDKNLGINHTKAGKGHYVYVSAVDKDNGTCTVHTFTSLESKAVSFDMDNKKYKYSFYDDRLSKVRSDMILPLVYDKKEFSKWTGINYNEINNIDISSLQKIGCKNISRKSIESIKRFTKK